MTDPFENELRQFKPRPAPAELCSRIQAELLLPSDAVPGASPWADRCLLSMLSMGAAAAVLITTLLLLDTRTPQMDSPLPASPTAQEQTHEYLTQLAGGRDISVTGVH